MEHRVRVVPAAGRRIPMELLVVETVDGPQTAMALQARVKDRDKDKVDMQASPQIPMELLVVEMATEVVHRAAMALLAVETVVVLRIPTVLPVVETVVVLRTLTALLVAAIMAVVPQAATALLVVETVVVHLTPMALLVAVTETAAVVVPQAAMELLVRAKVDLVVAHRTPMVLLVRTKNHQIHMAPLVAAMATADVLRAAMELQAQDLVADPPTPTDPQLLDREQVALEAVDPAALTTITM